jgi:hypothetical protein
MPIQVSASQTDDEGPQRQAEKPSAPQPPSRGRRPRSAAAAQQQPAQTFRTGHDEEQPFLPAEHLSFTGVAHSHLALQLFQLYRCGSLPFGPTVVPDDQLHHGPGLLPAITLPCLHRPQGLPHRLHLMQTCAAT